MALPLAVLGCVHSIPPPEPSPPIHLDGGPPVSGEHMGRVFLDVAPGRVRVDEYMTVNPHDVSVVKDVRDETITVRRNVLRWDDTKRDGEYEPVYKRETRLIVEYGWEHVADRRLVPLCETPCALDLLEGPHDLHLQLIQDRRWANLRVQATSTRNTYRVGLGRPRSA
jgi:hypothetical protein